MYRSDLNSGHRSGAIIAVAAVHAALFFVFLNISGAIVVPGTEEALRVFDITEPLAPPPPPPPPPPAQKQDRANEPEGGSAPNIESQATPVVVPQPRVLLPVPPKIAVSETPAQGTAPTQGAAPVPGPGTGSGGSGTGTGTGSGSGSGAGGRGGYVVPPRLVTPDLRGRDFPQALLRAWPRGRPLFARVRVAADGTVLQCSVDRGTGNPAIDSQVCATVRARLRYSPARNASGQPVAGWAGYVQDPPR
ncbi:MAG TPA: energy transducer TonB [Sphingomicrobium sp.]|nr:energy transducer TonB [Sphingomicrobium sp.]